METTSFRKAFLAPVVVGPVAAQAVRARLPFLVRAVAAAVAVQAAAVEVLAAVLAAVLAVSVRGHLGLMQQLPILVAVVAPAARMRLPVRR